MQKRKCCRTGINLISALGMLFLVLGLATSQIYLHTPKSLIALAELHPSEIKSCSININRTSGSSVDLYGEGLEPFLGQHRTENCVQKMSLRGKIKT